MGALTLHPPHGWPASGPLRTSTRSLAVVGPDVAFRMAPRSATSSGKDSIEVNLVHATRCRFGDSLQGGEIKELEAVVRAQEQRRYISDPMGHEAAATFS